MSAPRSLRSSPALIVAIVALVVAMGGTSYAAVTLAKNSVLSKHIKNGQVKTADLRASAVTGGKVKDGSLGAVDFAAGQLPAGPQVATGPAGPAGPQGVPGPVNTVTVVASSTVAAGTFGSATATCPAGKEVVGGGPSLGNVLTMVVTSSFPLVNGADPLTIANGEYPAATGWRAFARNDSGSPQTIKVAIVCGG